MRAISTTAKRFVPSTAWTDAVHVKRFRASESRGEGSIRISLGMVRYRQIGKLCIWKWSFLRYLIDSLVSWISWNSLVTEPEQSSEWALNPFTGTYKETSIISGIDAAIWSKTNFGPTGNLTLEAFPFSAYVLFPALLQLFKFTLEVCSMSVFSKACDCATITSIVSKWRPFSRGSRDV
jgi:hypothetical protein